MVAYFNDIFMDKDDIRISVDDRGFLFADGLYEVIRSYKGKLFRSKDHISRLNYGAVHLKLSRTEFSFLEDVARELIQRNNLSNEDAIIYFQVTRGAARRSHAFPDPAPDLTIYGAVSKLDATELNKKMEQGISVITVPDTRWARCDMKTTGLTANILANQLSVEQGAEEAIFIRDGVMLEGTHSSFAAVFDDVLVTAPLSNYILGGITRKVVLELCRKEKIRVEERPVFEKDIHLATELMNLGTTLEVTPIIQVNGTRFKEGKPGPITRSLQAAFKREIKYLQA